METPNTQARQTFHLFFTKERYAQTFLRSKIILRSKILKSYIALRVQRCCTPGKRSVNCVL